LGYLHNIPKISTMGIDIKVVSLGEQDPAASALPPLWGGMPAPRRNPAGDGGLRNRCFGHSSRTRFTINGVKTYQDPQHYFGLVLIDRGRAEEEKGRDWTAPPPHRVP
jgi:hypothetical protein